MIWTRWTFVNVLTNICLLSFCLVLKFDQFFALVHFSNLDFGQVDKLEGRYLVSSVVQEITYSKEHGAPCPHKKYDNERKKEQLDRLKPILVITEVEVGSDMYRQGYRWTQYINSNSWQKAPIHMVRTPLKIVKLPYPPSRLLWPT